MQNRLVILLLALLALVALPATAQDAPAHTDLAAQFPAETQVFVSLRLDDAFVGELTGVLDRFLPIIPEPFRPESATAALDEGVLSAFGVSTAELLGWAGDRAAFALLPAPPDNPFASNPAVLVLDLDDRQGMEAAFAEVIGSGLEQTTVGDFTTYTDTTQNTTYWFSDSALYVTDAETPYVPGNAPAASLAADATFTNALGNLPADTYNVFAFIDPLLLNAPAGPNDLLALGLTILDGRSLTIDSVSLLESAAFVTEIPALDPAFAAFIPATVDAYIQQTNPPALYEVVRATLAAQGDTTTLSEFEASLAQLGFDLEADVFSWATGEFALAYGAETVTLVRLLNDIATGNTDNLPLLAEFFDAGLILETSNPAASEAFRAKITETLAPLLAGDETVTLTETTIAAATVTVLTLDVPLDPGASFPVEVVIGGDERVFVIGTRRLAEQVFNGENPVLSTDAYADANAYALPNPISTSYANGEGVLLTLGVVPALALLGPTIENVFEEIITELESGTATEPTATPTPAPTPTPASGNPLAVQVTLDALALLSSGSAMTTVTDGGLTVNRIVLSLSAP